MLRQKQWMTRALAAVMVLSLTGCGSSGSTSTTAVDEDPNELAASGGL